MHAPAPAAQQSRVQQSTTPQLPGWQPGWLPGWRTLMSRMETWGTRLRLVSLLYSITCSSTAGSTEGSTVRWAANKGSQQGRKPAATAATKTQRWMAGPAAAEAAVQVGAAPHLHILDIRVAAVLHQVLDALALLLGGLLKLQGGRAGKGAGEGGRQRGEGANAGAQRCGLCESWRGYCSREKWHMQACRQARRQLLISSYDGQVLCWVIHQGCGQLRGSIHRVAQVANVHPQAVLAPSQLVAAGSGGGGGVLDG